MTADHANTSHPTPHPTTPVGFNPVAGFAAIALPGLGHIVLGEHRRGVCIAIGVLGLVLTGLLVGGIDSVDRREDRVWFLGQALLGPVAFGIDYIHQNNFKAYDQDLLTRDPARALRSALPGEARGVNAEGLPVWRAAEPGDAKPSTKGVGRSNELGMLFVTIAGMLNLIVIIDAGFPGGRSVPDDEDKVGAKKSGKDDTP